jgi:hypothetical protein
MKIFNSVNEGFIRSVKSWKGILITWLVSLLLVSLIAIPMKTSVESSFGTSTITEKLKDGFSFEVFKDLGSNYTSLLSYFSKGLLMIVLTGFLINCFFSGGLFNGLKGLPGGFSAGKFFRNSSKYFWSFLLISSILSLFILLLAVIIVLIPVVIASRAEVPSEVTIFNTGVIGSSIFLLFLIILILVADYARAWQVSHDNNSCFRAIGFGFRQSFRSFFSSYPLMLILIAVQVVYTLLVLMIIAGIKPVNGVGIILLFMLSQILFIIKILLKVLRYGCVTRMMELT